MSASPIDRARSKIAAMLQSLLARFSSGEPGHLRQEDSGSGIPGTLYDRAKSLMQVNRLEEAVVELDALLASHPDDSDAHVLKALCLLVQGDLEEGFRLFEWRWCTERARLTAHPRLRIWLGEEELEGKTLLLLREQGLGDMVQFSRYVPCLERMGIKVVLQSPPSLTELLSTVSPTVTIAETGRPPPSCDFVCPTMSLPHALRTNLASIPADVPYLHADSARREGWRARLGARAGLRVGICWRGAAGHKNDQNRSIPAQLLGELLAFPFEFHVLHKEVRPSDLDLPRVFTGVRFHHEHLHDFADTAALISELDLVISVDTAVAHVAGALACPVWILLPFSPDWRWLLERGDSPWYPTAALFRQERVGDWAGVLLKVRDRLQRGDVQVGQLSGIAS